MSTDGERVGEPLPEQQRATYMGLQWTAGSAADHLYDAWKRPVRHNRRIERAALHFALNIANYCERVSTNRPEHVRPKIGNMDARYDAEAGIRTIPTILPFTVEERRLLTANQHPHNPRFEHGIGDVALGQLELAEQWHDWLWTPPTNPLERRALPGAEAELLALACTRLTHALGQVMWASDHHVPPGSHA